MTALETASYMLNQDHFSKWLGVKLLEVREKYCKIQIPIRQDMINGLKTVHGGVIFAFADSALAFSSNNSGEAAVALNCTVNFTAAVRLGEVLIAESIFIAETRKTAVYDIAVRKENGELAAAFRGTVYKIGKKVIDL